MIKIIKKTWFITEPGQKVKHNEEANYQLEDRHGRTLEN